MNQFNTKRLGTNLAVQLRFRRRTVLTDYIILFHNMGVKTKNYDRQKSLSLPRDSQRVLVRGTGTYS